MFHCLNWHTLKLFAVSLTTLVALDIVWFCFFMKDFYLTSLANFIEVMPNNMLVINYPAAIAAWALVGFGIVYFVLPRTHGHYTCALVKGAVYGLIVYGVSSLCKFAVIAQWPRDLAIYDIAWGAAACALVTLITMYAAGLCGYEHMCTYQNEGKAKCL